MEYDGIINTRIVTNDGFVGAKLHTIVVFLRSRSTYIDSNRFRLMELNTAIFSGSGFPDDVANQTAAAVPEYLSYALVCIVFMGVPVAIVPALWAIIIIVENKKLQTNNNIFLINLLIADMGLVVALCCAGGLLTVLYLLGVNVDVDCRIEVIPTMIFLIANKLMFIPTCVDRFIHIAFPFSYKRIVTTKAIMITIITLWMIAIVTATVLYIDEPFEYIPSVGACVPTQTNIPAVLILLLCYFIPFVLITITSISLRHRIIKSKNFFHSVKRTVALERKSRIAGRLAEILEEQVKPTMAVFTVGGYDAVLDILTAVITAVAFLWFPSNNVAFIVTGPLLSFPIECLQSLNHCLVYNVDIREKIFACIKVKKKHSKVVVLHRE